MPQVKSIIPIQPDPIQCSEPFTRAFGYNASCIARRIERMEKRGKDPYCCDRWAKYIINGRYLCATHAKTAALKLLMEEG